jgi:hypothetical protein
MSDAKIAGELRKDGVSFRVQPYHDKFVVTRVVDDDDEGKNVVFELSSGVIAVREGPNRALFAARPRLSDEGECLLEVDGHLLRLWQISQKALEDLFFER